MKRDAPLDAALVARAPASARDVDAVAAFAAADTSTASAFTTAAADAAADAAFDRAAGAASHCGAALAAAEPDADAPLAQRLLALLAPGSAATGAAPEAHWLVALAAASRWQDAASAWSTWRAAPPAADARLHRLVDAMDLNPSEAFALALAHAADADVMSGRALAWLQAPLREARPTLGLVACLDAQLGRDAGTSLTALLDGAAIESGLLQLDEPADRASSRADAALRLPLPLLVALAGGCGAWPGVTLQRTAPPLAPSIEAEALRRAQRLGPGDALVLRSGDPDEARAACIAVAQARGMRAAVIEGVAPAGVLPWLILQHALPVLCAEPGPGERRLVPTGVHRLARDAGRRPCDVAAADGRADGLERHAGANVGHAGAIGGHAGTAAAPAVGMEGHAGATAGHAGAIGGCSGATASHAGGIGGQAGATARHACVAAGPLLIAGGLDGSWQHAGAALAEWRLPMPAPAERALIWSALGHAPATAQQLARTQRHTAARIAALHAHAGVLARDAGAARTEPEHLHRAARQADAGTLGALAQPLADDIDAAALVLTPPLRAELDALVERCRQREGLADALGPAARTRYRPGVRALLVGASGTGKTLACGWLATRLSKPLFRVDLAGVTSKYIGETEKNLGELFARAEHADVVLLFDEADSLFGKRTEVKDANDRYANQQTNYLLQRIEAYDGIVLLTSNSRSRFDGAFTRRLDAILDFPAPGPAERRELWLAHLGSGHALTPAGLNRLAAGCDFAGGHIRNVVLTARAVAGAAAADAPGGTGNDAAGDKWSAPSGMGSDTSDGTSADAPGGTGHSAPASTARDAPDDSAGEATVAAAVVETIAPIDWPHLALALQAEYRKLGRTLPAGLVPAA